VSRQLRNVRARRWLLEGLLASQRGSLEEAILAFTRSAEVAEAMDMDFDVARAALERARLLQPSPAREADLALAAANFAALGATDLLQQVAAL
jgi:hypothetical protein